MADAKNQDGILLATLIEIEKNLKSVVMGDDTLSQQIISNAYKLLPALRREILKRTKKV